MKREFEILPEHLTLLRNAYVRWEDCEFGAPAIDCKRPYGNSYVYGDIADILGILPSGEFSSDQMAYMSELHRGTEIVLQIILHTGEARPGFYKYNSGCWERV